MISNTLANARRLIKAATGEEYGDGYTVTSVLHGYAGGDRDAVVVLGDWNPRSVAGVTRARHDDESLPTRWESKDKRVTMPARLFDALERIGAECHWLDEWTECGDCYRAVRTEPDSYHWKPAYAYVEDAGYVCHGCLLTCGEDALADYVNDAHKCITWCEPAHVESFGYVKWEPGNEQTYESGRHPGQTDKPEEILEQILAQHPEASVVFFLDETSQFYIRFSAYFRTEEGE